MKYGFISIDQLEKVKCSNYSDEEDRKLSAISDIFYYEENNKIWCFTLDNLQTLKISGINPYNDRKFPKNFSEWLDSLNPIILEEIKELEDNVKKIYLEELIERNAIIFKGRVKPKQDTRRNCQINTYLAQYFPIIGKGTQKQVYDAGTFILKSVDDSVVNTWDFGLDNAFWNTAKAKTYTIDIETLPVGAAKSKSGKSIVQMNNCYLVAQEKVEMIDRPEEYKEEIFKLYPRIANRYKDEYYVWEWGINKDGIPVVVDWG